MLQDIIKDLQSSLKSYSQGFAKQNLLVEIPWTMVDGDLNVQRLIFRKNNSLYIVKEGEIQESTWEYLPSLNSLVITVGGRRILMNEVFVDGKALILKKDGQSMDFLSFANQNELPNLNLVEYLTNKLTEPIKVNEIVEDSTKNHSIVDVFVKILIFLIVLFVLVSGLIEIIK